MTIFHRTRTKLMSNRCVILCLTLCYFVFINIALALLIYDKHNHALYESKKLHNSRVKLGQNAIYSQSELESHESSACQVQADVFVVLIPETQLDQSYSLSSSSYSRVLYEIERATHNVRIFVLILVSLDSFHPIHRNWCKNIQKDHTCKLQILDQTHINDVIQTIAKHRFCGQHYLLMSDALIVDITLLNRLKMLPSNKVSCLLPNLSPSKAEQSNKHILDPTQAQNFCPSLAYNLPANFSVDVDKVTTSTPLNKVIWLSAIQQNLYAGNFPVCSSSKFY